MRESKKGIHEREQKEDGKPKSWARLKAFFIMVFDIYKNKNIN